jgi:hypothetical protein
VPEVKLCPRLVQIGI